MGSSLFFEKSSSQTLAPPNIHWYYDIIKIPSIRSTVLHFTISSGPVKKACCYGKGNFDNANIESLERTEGNFKAYLSGSVFYIHEVIIADH